ncbi:hypothetical protein LMH87_000736 [Akanthomyces muscarius]|uniref:Uncharacterized protein n=1 Tax=Akanthomyces muscarius TaxID=2231603 RepID=A0A9W8UP40_AKAMU|nr:hypothetical protein LMH87_000736 [Akanthomyces muscarius]KAJ4155496.1 hypothetical protein LMH87_000736 [Akanthomyces muscarius]
MGQMTAAAQGEVQLRRKRGLVGQCSAAASAEDRLVVASKNSHFEFIARKPAIASDVCLFPYIREHVFV